MRKDELHLSDILVDRYSEEDLIEVTLPDKAIKLVFVIISAVLVLTLIQAFNIGILKHQLYRKKAVLNVSSLNIELAPRGIIYDVQGKSLVKNELSFNVFLSYSRFPQEENIRNEYLQKISSILSLDKRSLEEKITAKVFHFQDKILLKQDISYEEFINLESQNIDGLEVLPSYKRKETVPFKFAHVLGYVSLANEEDLKNNPDLYVNDVVGRDGLERYYDSYLRGKNGQRVYIKDASGNIEDKNIRKEAKAGNDLYTSIDFELQSYFYDALNSTLKSLGKTKGLGIAMNPQNGEVLAIFNIPSYEVSNVAKYLNAPGEPLFNKAIAGLYNPASTIKPLVAIGALVEGLLNPERQIFSPGYIYVPNPYNPQKPTKFLDWQYQGWVDMYSAIAKSSDVYFYAVGGGYGDQKGLGIYGLKKWWQKFLLDKKTGIDLVGENEGFLPDPEWKVKTRKDIWRIGDTYNVSIGQGDLLITPIELLNYINAIANGGILYKPKIVKSIVDKDGNIVLEKQPEVLADLREEIGKYIPLIQKAMIDTVSKPYGTAHFLADLPIQVAGKTGSAQVEGNKKTNAFFVGYAPAHNPQISILVLVEDAKEGSLNAVPVAKEVFLWYYRNRLTKSP